MKELLAYHHWLLRECKGDKTLLALLIHKDLMERNPMAWDLLEETGDNNYTVDTFFKAAELLINHKP